ncbi:hypothetical protein [Microbacterium sp. GXF7504]
MTVEETVVCSRAGCRDAAVWAVQWRNPRIHAADRRKTWAACDAHVAFLRDYLTTRSFPVQVLPLSEIGDRAR